MTMNADNALKSTNDNQSPLPPAPHRALALLTLPREEALALARVTSSADLAHTLSGLQKSSELGMLVGLLPADQVGLVLLQDARVFEPALTHDINQETYDDPQGAVRPVTHREYLRLREMHARWLVPVAHNALGEPTRWGLRTSVMKISDSEALERLEAILEADNDTDWKRAALRALPATYVSLALRCLRKESEQRADDLFDQIEELLAPSSEQEEKDGKLIQELVACDVLDHDELHTRLVEERGACLAAVAKTIVLTPAAVAAVKDVGERGSSRDLLAELRGG